ncbi:hypothetical protein [Burkholderia gladioli]|uniref:hypothetical protein n=1 Tax=Burkholderia gladioli TaxID=28095 RepID=UPI0034DAF465
MMTLRLPESVEAALEAYCRRHGMTKNAAVTKATEQLLASPEISTLQLAEPLDEPEDAETRYQRRLERLQQQYEIEVTIAGWIAEQVVWTQKHDPSGKVHPGMIGRNTVVGFCDTLWDADGKLLEGVFIIAEHHSGRAAGIQAHHRYVMSYETWLANMRIVPRA